MPEPIFWRTTPRKLHALLDAHVRANTPDKENKQPTVKNPKEAAKKIMSW